MRAMLSITDGSPARSGDGQETRGLPQAAPLRSRRSFLTVGGIGGLSLPLLLGHTARASGSSKPGSVTGKSVIFIFQQGGPSQFETLDPKLEGPTESRSLDGTIPTNLPGVHFGASLPRLARRADRLTIVRSYQSQNAGHNIRPLVGPDSLEANIGCHLARHVGATDSRTGLPTSTVIYPRAVDPEAPPPEARGNLAATGPYPSSFAPLVAGQGGPLQDDMTLELSPRRLDDRRQLLGQLDRLERNLDASGRLDSLDRIQQQAYRLLLGGGMRRALDLSQEDERTRALYDTRSLTRPGQWNRVNRGRRGYYHAQASTIGSLLLLARRLCEAGCGFVTVHAGYAGVWDMHADGNNLNMVDGMQAVGRSFDHALAALIDDLERRGLSEKILVVATGEMGRTPRVNPRGGRDHWSRLSPLLLHGGGLPGGQVIGASDRQGGEPDSTAFGPPHLISTILNTVLDLGELRLETAVAPEVTRLISHDPIPGTV